MTTYTDVQIRTSSDLQRWVEKRRVAEEGVRLSVGRARDAELTWAQVGAAIGCSGQAAWERYGLTDQQKAERSRQTNRAFTQPQLTDVELSSAHFRQGHEPSKAHGQDGDAKQP